LRGVRILTRPGHRGLRGRIGDYSALRFAALMIGRHLSISTFVDTAPKRGVA
jgi:hypothetical protein